RQHRSAAGPRIESLTKSVSARAVESLYTMCGLPGLFLGVSGGAEEVQRDVRLVADHPAVVRIRRDVEERPRGEMLGAFAVCALAIAGVGLFGVLSYGVAQ